MYSCKNDKAVTVQYLELLTSIIKLERKPIIDTLIKSGYIPVILMILRDLTFEFDLLQMVLWQIGLLCTEDNDRSYSTFFIEMNLIEIMFDLK
jgi:hypothetical protein